MANYLNQKTLTGLVSAGKSYLIGAAAVGLTALLLNKLYFSGGVCNSKRRLDGKTVIITGANTGIGKETALDLAKRGARVILACRDIKKAQEAAEEIRKLSGNGNIVVEKLDLASLESVRTFAEKINKQEERINILINNAGIMMCPRWETADKFEMQIGTNHFGHFLLTNLLLDKIKQSAPSRIVNVSSRAYEKGKMNWDDLMHTKNYDPQTAYRQSKLANVLFTRELAKRLQGSNVTVSALHPGVVRTELFRYAQDSAGFWFNLLFMCIYPLMMVVLKSPKEGAQTSIYCAVSEDVDGVSGKYFSDCKEKALMPHALADDDANKLWQLSEDLTKLNKK